MSQVNSYLPTDEQFEARLRQRNLVARLWGLAFMAAILIAIIALVVLFWSIARQAFGVVAEDYRNNPDELAQIYLRVDAEADTLSDEEKIIIVSDIYADDTARLRILTLEYARPDLNIDAHPRVERSETVGEADQFSVTVTNANDMERLREVLQQPVSEIFEEGTYPEETADLAYGTELNAEQYTRILYNHIEGDDNGFTTFIRAELGDIQSPAIAFDDLTPEQLSAIAEAYFAFDLNERNIMRNVTLDWVLGVTLDDREQLQNVSRQPVNEQLEEGQYPEEVAEEPLGSLTVPQYAEILRLNLDDEQLRNFVIGQVAQLQVVKSWPLNTAILDYSSIEEEVETSEELQGATLRWYSWVNAEFLTNPMNTRPEIAGIRTALLGSIWMISLTALIAFPLGVGAAVYLEEYAEKNRLNGIIQTNIYNLAGVPSIIYGILGLAIFVRALEAITSGSFLSGSEDTTANGRTILSAALTMSLLILPVIIISSQEAIRAVPNSLRQASYGLGATKWQTVWNHVLPNALPGIMTGTILSISRAIGETAPLIVVGASTYIITNPDSPFAKFTVLPIQIYRWTSEPEPEFRDAAAAAIVVLLVLLLSLNSIAIVLRNRFTRRI